MSGTRPRLRSRTLQGAWARRGTLLPLFLLTVVVVGKWEGLAPGEEAATPGSDRLSATIKTSFATSSAVLPKSVRIPSAASTAIIGIPNSLRGCTPRCATKLST